MQIVINVGPNGEVALTCDEERPWIAVAALRAAADGIAAKQLQKETEGASGLIAVNGVPPGLADRLRNGGG